MKKTLISAMMLMASSAALAGDFHYSYVEAGYGETDHGGDGLFVGGAMDLKQGLGLIGSFYSQNLDHDVTRDILTFGGQFHTPLDNRTDFVASMQLVSADADCKNAFGYDVCDSKTGLLARAGVRFTVQPKLQLEGDLSYNTNDYWDGSELGLKVGARYYVDPHLSLTAGVASNQENDGIYLGGRYDLK